MQYWWARICFHRRNPLFIKSEVHLPECFMFRIPASGPCTDVKCTLIHDPVIAKRSRTQATLSFSRASNQTYLTL
jgi:hypothetical protein